MSIVEIKNSIEGILVASKADSRKFTEGVELVARVRNAKKNDNFEILSGSLNLPNGLGRDLKLLIISKDINSNYEYDRKSKYDICGGIDLIQKIKDDELKLNFDYCLSDIQTLPSLSAPLAKILGPRGLMPNVKKGTAGNDIKTLINDFTVNGKILFKSDKYGNIHLRIGSSAFSVDQVYDNILSVMNAINKVKIDSERSLTIDSSVTIKTTMGKPLRINISDVLN